MSLTYPAAVDQMVRLLLAEWNARAGAVVGGNVPTLLWPTDAVKAPSVVQPFGRFFQRHYSDPRHTLGPKGARRYSRSGQLTVQTHGPIIDNDLIANGNTIAESLAIIARDAFEGVGTVDGLRFFNARIVDIAADSTYHRIQTIAEFQYDEVR